MSWLRSFVLRTARNFHSCTKAVTYLFDVFECAANPTFNSAFVSVVCGLSLAQAGIFLDCELLLCAAGRAAVDAMVKEACANCLAMCAYGLVLRLLLPTCIFPDWCFMLQITAVASFGYLVGLFALIAASWLLHTDVHTQRCREWTTIQIFGVSFGNCCLVCGFSEADNVF